LSVTGAQRADAFRLPVSRLSGAHFAMSPRKPIVSVVFCCAVLALAPWHPADAEEFAPEQRQKIENLIHDYLLQHPDVLIDALRAAEQKLKSDADDKAKQALAARRKEIFDDPQTPVGGNPKGDVTLVEFFDYRCPYCKQVHPRLQELLAGDHNLRIAYKEFPILGAVSVGAARAALAAQRQGKYEAFHNAMMAVSGQITDETVYQVAKTVGLDVDRLKRDMAAPQIEAQRAGEGGARPFLLNFASRLVCGHHWLQLFHARLRHASLDRVADSRRSGSG
jgi:protein-disulfide isomerase